jgi:mannose-6-phosphate isomerase-like protein (cupin superfamily)
MQVINLGEKFSLIQDTWHPRIAAELNGQQIKLVKLKGEFVWHQHDQEDELFMVVKGTLKIRLPESEVTIHEGEFFVVARGTKHCPVAEDECQVMLIEPASTLNTGSVRDKRTVENPEWI